MRSYLIFSVCCFFQFYNGNANLQLLLNFQLINKEQLFPEVMCLIYYALDMLLHSSIISTYDIFLQCTRGSISEVLNDKESQMIPSFLISIPPFNPQQLMEQTPLFTNVQGHGYSLVNIYSSKKKKRLQLTIRNLGHPNQMAFYP